MCNWILTSEFGCNWHFRVSFLHSLLWIFQCRPSVHRFLGSKKRGRKHSPEKNKCPWLLEEADSGLIKVSKEGRSGINLVCLQAQPRLTQVWKYTLKDLKSKHPLMANNVLHFKCKKICKPACEQEASSLCSRANQSNRPPCWWKLLKIISKWEPGNRALWCCSDDALMLVRSLSSQTHTQNTILWHLN